MTQTVTLENSTRSLTLLPLCGTLRLDYESFSYFVVGRWDEGVEISSPAWLSRSHSLNEFDLVRLHLTLKQGDKFYTGGVVKEILTKEDSPERIYRLQFSQEPMFSHEYYVSLDEAAVPIFASDTDFSELFVENVKECILLKKGVLVYTKHLAVYFSRLIGYDNPKYSQFSRFFFDEIIQQLSEKIQKLTELHEGLLSNQGQVQFGVPLNFQIIHELVESELNLDVLNLTFKEGQHLPYILSIKQLEDKMFCCYNLLLMIYEAFIKGRMEDVEAKLTRMIQRTDTVR